MKEKWDNINNDGKDRVCDRIRYEKLNYEWMETRRVM